MNVLVMNNVSSFSTYQKNYFLFFIANNRVEYSPFKMLYLGSLGMDYVISE